MDKKLPRDFKEKEHSAQMYETAMHIIKVIVKNY